MSARRNLLALTALSFLAWAPSAQAQEGAAIWAGTYLGVHFSGLQTNLTGASLQLGAGTYLGPATQSAQNIHNRSGAEFDFSQAGGGFQVGHNFVLGNWVLGAEADMTFLRGSNSATTTAALSNLYTFNASYTAKHDWVATMRGRLGYAVDNVLLYGTAGLSLTDLSFQSTYADGYPATGSTSAHKVATRAVIGTGGEYALTKAMSLKVEYLYMPPIGSVSGSGMLNAPGNFSNILNSSVDVGATHMGKVGLSFKF